MSTDLDEAGFLVVGDVLTQKECDVAASALARRAGHRAGTRNLLVEEWCRALGERLRQDPRIAPWLPPGTVVAQCTLFDKSPQVNWLVPMHQDLSIPVKERVTSVECSGWSDKEGMLFVQPPTSLLARLVALRLHLDDCGEDNGPLRVVPGSHRFGRLGEADEARLRNDSSEVTCLVGRGGVVLMRPLLLHASSKIVSDAHRRVLHFLYGPGELPCGLRWPLH